MTVWKKKYSDKLRDPRWQKKRLEVFERDNFCCQCCFDSGSTLAVHHLRYITGNEPWDYPNDMLLTLCEGCHNAEYEGMKDSIESLVEQIKDRGFLCGSIDDLAYSFNGLVMTKPTDVMASIIRWAFCNKDVMEELEEKYFNSLPESK
jgi:hypothetical protein